MGLGGGQPIIDGWIIPEDLSVTFANRRQNPVDVIAGFNKDEHTGFGGANNTNTAPRDAMAWHARLFAEKQTQLGRKAYFYVFTHEPPQRVREHGALFYSEPPVTTSTPPYSAARAWGRTTR